MKHLIKEEITENYKFKNQVQEMYNSAITENQRGCFVDQLLEVGKKFPIKQYCGLLDNEPVAVYTEFICKEFASFCNFAIVPSFQNQGIGAYIVKDFIDRYSDHTIIADLEALDLNCGDLEKREKRIKFYEKLGFKMNPYLIVRPRGVVGIGSLQDNIDSKEYGKIIRPFGEECHKQKIKLLTNGTYHKDDLKPVKFKTGYLVGFGTNPVQDNIQEISKSFQDQGYELFWEKYNDLIEETFGVADLDTAMKIMKQYNQYCIGDYKNQKKIYNPEFDKSKNDTGE